MLDSSIAENRSSIPPEAIQGRSRKVLRMVKNERMAGFIPVWEKASGGLQKVEENLGRAITRGDQAHFQNALAYQGAHNGSHSSAAQDRAFGFGDIIDMVNPLHHIPVVGHLYRHLTGDEIKPISTIIGGAVFGGPIGAAGGLVNIISQEETGKDLAGNAMAMIFDGKAPDFKSNANNPEEHLTASLQSLASLESEAINTLPGSALSFADLGGGRRMVSEKIPAADGRTAGTMVRKHYVPFFKK